MYCTVCPEGKFSNVTNAAGCYTCPTGQYTPFVVLADDSITTGGLPEDSQDGNTECYNCKAGQYNDEEGTHIRDGGHECKECEAGNYVEWESHHSCYSCPSAKYQDQVAYAVCHDCPHSKWTAGKTGDSRCVAIPTPYPTPYPTSYPTPYPTRYPTPAPTPFPTPYPTPFPTPFPTPMPTPDPHTDSCTQEGWLSGFTMAQYAEAEACLVRELAGKLGVPAASRRVTITAAARVDDDPADGSGVRFSFKVAVLPGGGALCQRITRGVCYELIERIELCLAPTPYPTAYPTPPPPTPDPTPPPTPCTFNTCPGMGICGAEMSCSSSGDPHIHMFGGGNYAHPQGNGAFDMAASPDRSFVIQVTPDPTSFPTSF
jgi:hypothetical protein